MPVTLNPIITDAGLAAAVNAAANGVQLAITHIALGTGKYTADVNTVSGMTAMVGRKEKLMPGVGSVSGVGGFVIAGRFTSWTGTPATYDASELGFWAGDPDAGGVLFAAYSHPTDIIVTRNSLDYVFSFLHQLTRVPPGSITVALDPDAVQWQAMLQLHLGHSDPHIQYVKKSGDTSTGAQLGVTAPQHDNTKKFATTEYVVRQGQRFPGGIGATVTPFNLAVAQLGRWIEIAVPNGIVNLPAANTVPEGASYVFRCVAQVATIRAAEGEAIRQTLYDTPARSYPVTSGETLTVTRNGTGEAAWYVTSAGSRLPAGMTTYFIGNSVPPGWLHLNGAVLSREAYPFLFAYALTTEMVSDADWMGNGYWGRFSAGTAGDNFRIPDTRGIFLRALDEGRGIDAGRIWGRFQDHANVYHAHGGITGAAGAHDHAGIQVPSNVVDIDRGSLSSLFSVDSPRSLPMDGYHSHDFTTYGDGGADGRPRNLAYRFCVKY